MKLVINSVEPQQVRETFEAYIIENVPFVRPMRLSGGYVPENSIKRTANKWSKKPATLNHPRNPNGEPVAAARKPETHLGEIENPTFDGEYVRGDIRINKADLENAGPEADDIQRKLENGEQIDVSSQYAAQELEPGEYDGEYRENVERIVRPDSVAILPNKPGVCSVEDGCGINPQMVANAEVSLTVRSNAEISDGDIVEWDDGSAIGVVEDTISDGELSDEIDGDVTISAPAALIEVLEETDDGLVRTGTMVGHKTDTDTLSIVDNPPEIMEANATDVPDEFVFDNPGEAMNKAEELGLGEIHTHGEGEDTVFMPGETHEDLVSELEEIGEMEANMEVSGVMFDSTGTGKLDESAIDPEETTLSNHYLYGDGEDKEDYSYPVVDADGVLRRGNVDAAHQLGCRGQCPGDEQHTENLQALAQEFDNPPEWADMEGSAEHMEDNTLKEIGKRVLQSLGVTTGTQNSSETIGAESPVDSTESAGDSDSNVNREQLKAEIVDNSRLTEESLAERCNDGLKAIHSDVMANAETETMEENEDAIVFESREDFENTVEEIVANRLENSEKQEMAEDIVANSAEYEDTETVLEDYPTTAALKDKKELVTDSGSALPGTGMTPNAGSDNTDEFPDMEIGGEL